MQIATWNVNSIRTRLPRLLAWLEQDQPDIVCIQELKCTEEQFPFEPLESAGYTAVVNAQKTYNGVAILSRTPAEDVQPGFSQWEDSFNGKSCARLISAWFEDGEGNRFRVFNGYFPVGDMPGTDKFQYKLDWYDALIEELNQTASPDENIILVGDMNVYRDPLLDAKFPEAYEGGPLGNPPLRAKFNELLAWGFHDLYRELNPKQSAFSWFDYRRAGFLRNDGLRLDHILATGPMAVRCREIQMLLDLREGEKPSDHLPVIAMFC